MFQLCGIHEAHAISVCYSFFNITNGYWLTSVWFGWIYGA